MFWVGRRYHSVFGKELYAKVDKAVKHKVLGRIDQRFHLWDDQSEPVRQANETVPLRRKKGQFHN